MKALRAKATMLFILLALPAVAGCTLPWDREDRWRLDVTLGLLVSSRPGGYPLDDVASAAEAATRQFDSAQAGVRFTIHRETVQGGATAAFDRLLQKGAIVVIAGVQPDEAKALIARAAVQKRVLVLATPVNDSLAGVDTSWTLQVAPEPSAHAGALASLVETTNVSSVAILRPQDPFVQLTSAAFEAAYSGTIDMDSTYVVGNQGDVVAAARGLCASSASAVVLFGNGMESGWALRAIHESCPGRFQFFGGPATRQHEVNEAAGKDLADKPIAAGLQGVEPKGSRLSVFQSIFQAESSRTPSPFAAEGFDGTIDATLAAFASKGAPRIDPVRTTIRASDVQAHIMTVVGGGVTLRDIVRATDAAKLGEDFDWAGYAHDFPYSDARRPIPGPYVGWRVSPAGGLETDDTVNVSP